MKLLSFIGLLALPLTLAKPFSNPQSWAEDEGPQRSHLYVKPDIKPWGSRQIVPIPTTGNLGLENFTIHPTTPGIKFLPIQLPNSPSSYALQVSPVDWESDDDAIAYIAAVYSPGSHRAALRVIHLAPEPVATGAVSAECMDDGLECHMSQWKIEEGVLTYGGFGGEWVVVKDVSPYGWSVYWSADAGNEDGHVVVLEVGV
ncbi:hypothetical protein P154DRAFT_594682 [Amniculicola lignicola CBS 123094]|uniref:Ubiquitin 3 binding protein But2 C-terminal domain-containing protein n=1 Tax=Amniculicola lignicola CBS 123094 TaxID=1392246 RepID=A0A6A5WMS9_9PLEO|nr:hypothetical protein P154DRAFT_594682 [Amniculicola lignicola CBS 123094]